jgi:sulfatase maturation enzyme AslB (radical SAM superfamily)
VFFNNLEDSLDLVFNNIDNRPISLDITGNEPTFDVDVFAKLMNVISKYKSKAQKVVLTTN